MTRFLLVLLALLAATSLKASDPSAPQCTDDRGANRCAEEVQAKTRALYGLETVETLAAQGTFVRRAMIVDGYGQDVLAISFLREKGADPRVEIRAPREAEAKKILSLTSAISAAQWDELLGRGKYFDRDFVSLPTKSELSFCLHGSVAIAETADPVRLSNNTLPAATLPALTRAKAQSECENGLVMDYAFELVDLAYAALPFCQGIPLAGHRNKVAVLNVCLRLSGDRVAAGQASGLLHEQRQAIWVATNSPVAGRSAMEQIIATPDINVVPLPGNNRLTRAQRSTLVDILLVGDLYLVSANGVDADHVTIEVRQLQNIVRDGKSSNFIRNLKLLTSQEAGQFRIYGIEAGPFAPDH